MKRLEEMTRRELAEIIVDDLIERGITKAERKEAQIQGRLKGVGALKPMSWTDLYETVLAMVG